MCACKDELRRRQSRTAFACAAAKNKMQTRKEVYRCLVLEDRVESFLLCAHNELAFSCQPVQLRLIDEEGYSTLPFT